MGQHLTWASRSLACTIFLRSQRLRAVTMATWPCTHSSFCSKNDTLVKASQSRDVGTPGTSGQPVCLWEQSPTSSTVAWAWHRKGTHLTQHELHIAELAALP